ncbi:MAG: hypothetical protein JO279_11005 [Verrucomicrobia bacterium]|nr:hypothetical protein [Verrucomicrobiota bacterium]
MPTQTSPSTAKKGYETRDVPARPWAWFTLGFAASLLIICLGTFVFIRFLAAPGTIIGRTGHPADKSLVRFPEPQLQSNPSLDLHKYLQHKQDEINTYGWIDRRSGIVRIPIERAVDIFVNQGAPARPPDSGLTELDMQNQKAGVEQIKPPDAGVLPPK